MELLFLRSGTGITLVHVIPYLNISIAVSHVTLYIHCTSYTTRWIHNQVMLLKNSGSKYEQPNKESHTKQVISLARQLDSNPTPNNKSPIKIVSPRKKKILTFQTSNQLGRINWTQTQHPISNPHLKQSTQERKKFLKIITKGHI